MIAVTGTVLAVVLIAIGVSIDLGVCQKVAVYPNTNFFTALFSLGTFMFTLCGHAYFPTIQHDMRRPEDFTKSVILGFIR